MEGLHDRDLARPGEDRCPSCGALVSSDAEWCGQCFAALKAPPVPSREELAANVGIKITEAPAETTADGAGDSSGPTKPRLTWPCPLCEYDNDIERNHCERCGTPFGALLKADDAPVHVDPVEAVKWSLVFPGLGHRAAGHPLEGITRAALFTLSLILLLMVVLSGTGSLGQSLMEGLYLVTTLAVYVGSALEAYRVARGRSMFVSSRGLVWITVAVLLGSIGLLALTATALRR